MREISHQRAATPGLEQLVRRSRAALAAAAQTVSEPRTPKQELLLRRRNRRKVDFDSMPGLKRESTRLYLNILNGDITMEQAEIQGRAISRHREILTALKQEGQLEELITELRAVRNDRAISLDDPDLIQ